MRESHAIIKKSLLFTCLQVLQPSHDTNQLNFKNIEKSLFVVNVNTAYDYLLRPD